MERSRVGKVTAFFFYEEAFIGAVSVNFRCSHGVRLCRGAVYGTSLSQRRHFRGLRLGLPIKNDRRGGIISHVLVACCWLVSACQVMRMRIRKDFAKVWENV